MAAVKSAGPTVRLPDITTKGIYEGRCKDRSPDIRAAGKLTATGDSAQLCMRPSTVGRPDSPPVVRKFRATYRPDAGKTRIFYGRANDPHLRWAAEMTHGVTVQPSVVSGELLNPDPKTRFHQGMLDKREGVYASHKRAPLGKSHDQSSGFPVGVDFMAKTYGIKTHKDGSAGELVSPNKTREDVNAEYEQGRDLYRKTHCNYMPGEQNRRNYVEPNFQRNARFGIPTPHSNDGRHVRKTMQWLFDTKQEKQAEIVSKRVDDFRERTEPQLGKVHDPIKDTLNVPDDHTFGILIKPDEYGAGDLMHNRGPGTYLRGTDQQRGVLAAIRQHLKKANYHNFQDLLAAFKYYDRDQSGKIDITELREACVQFNLPVEPELLEQLMDYCDVDRDGQISYVEFANFLNWKDKLPSGLSSQGSQEAIASEELQRLKKQIDRAIGEHRTSSSMINATVGGVSTKNYRAYGVPTIRTDRPAPRIRRIDDTTNYGDESNAYGLLNPSIYTSHGVYEKDFLIPRPREDVRDIFTSVGVHMTLDTFDKIFDMAAARHPTGHVSVEAFRNVLDELQASRIQESDAGEASQLQGRDAGEAGVQRDAEATS